MKQVLAHCLTGGSRRPGIGVRSSHRRRSVVQAAGLKEVDVAKARLHCHRSRSMLVFRIQ
jgi:hypothetical protein